MDPGHQGPSAQQINYGAMCCISKILQSDCGSWNRGTHHGARAPGDDPSSGTPLFRLSGTITSLRSGRREKWHFIYLCSRYLFWRSGGSLPQSDTWTRAGAGEEGEGEGAWGTCQATPQAERLCIENKPVIAPIPPQHGQAETRQAEGAWNGAQLQSACMTQLSHLQNGNAHSFLPEPWGDSLHNLEQAPFKYSPLSSL